jgi:hypothetical protein
MVMKPSDNGAIAINALEAQLAALRTVRVAVRQIESRGIRLSKSVAQADAHLHMALSQSVAAAQFLPSAASYYWSAWAARAVENGSREYPLDDAILTPERLRDSACWYWCDEGFFSIDAGSPDGTISPERIRGIVAGVDRAPSPKLLVVAFSGDVTRPYPVAEGAWLLGEKVSAASNLLLVGNDLRESTEEDPRRKLFRFVLAAQQWVSQRILVASPAEVERHARKRVVRELALEPALHVITLRARESAHSVTHSVDAAVEWQCQWIVSGHWRKQYFPFHRRARADLDRSLRKRARG